MGICFLRPKGKKLNKVKPHLREKRIIFWIITYVCCHILQAGLPVNKIDYLHPRACKVHQGQIFFVHRKFFPGARCKRLFFRATFVPHNPYDSYRMLSCICRCLWPGQRLGRSSARNSHNKGAGEVVHTIRCGKKMKKMQEGAQIVPWRKTSNPSPPPQGN